MTAGLVWFHRWLGVATCLVFALWFASGAVLLFKPFPSLPKTQAIELLPPLDLAGVAVTPASAVAAANVTATSVRLVQRAGRPAYIVEGGERAVAIDARSGRGLALLEKEAVGANANPIDYDQWMVHNQFDPYRPFYRIASPGQGGTDLYVSAITGETLQRTTSSDRAWNWVGAVLHWVYFTPLRSSFSAWDWTVWTMSFVAMLVAIAGTVLGVMRTVTAMKQRRPSLSYFRLKWLRWHHLLGLFVGVFVLTWIFSGWLSMDHGRIFSRGTPSKVESFAYEGGSLQHVLSAIPLQAINEAGQVRAIEFAVVAGAPVLSVHDLDGRVRRLDGVGHPLTDAALAGLVTAGLEKAWKGAHVQSISTVEPTDLYALAEGWPATVRRARLAGGSFPDVYVDGQNGRLLTVMDRSRASYAWVYYALHTFNFPALTGLPWLRETLVLIPLSVGFAFSVTGVIIGWQRIRK